MALDIRDMHPDCHTVKVKARQGQGIGHRSSMKVIRKGLDNEIGQKASSRPEYSRLHYQDEQTGLPDYRKSVIFIMKGIIYKLDEY